MKKKLLLSVLAAGLVLPSAAALAEEAEYNNPNVPKDVLAKVNGDEAKKSETTKKADAAKKDAEDLVKENLAPKPDKGVKVGDVWVYSPDKKVNTDKGPAKNTANKEVKKPLAPTDNKAANKAGMKKLPKTSAVK